MSLHKLPTKKYTEDAMSRALIELQSKSLSLRAAAKKYGVPKSSLSDRYTGKVQDGSKWGRQTLLTQDEERTLIDHAMRRADLGIGFTKATFLRFSGQFAEEKGVCFKGGDASEKWWRGLKSRHSDFSLRTPEATSSGRHLAMTRERICKYFAALKGVIEDHNLSKHPVRIWNMDETGLSLAHNPAKVMARKGTKAVQSKVSNSRELVTVIACGNASGNSIPPHVILPGKSERVFKGYDIDCAPNGTNLSVSETGWSKEGIGRLWFTTTFLPNIGDARPQLLIFDGHGSHNHIEFVEIARKEDIILVELPSKTSHWTQPFDRTVFKSMKSKWNSNIQTFMSETGVSVGHAQFFRMFKKSWNESMTTDNISSGFVATGISPYNPGIIPDVAYIPSDLYVTETSTASPTIVSADLPLQSTTGCASSSCSYSEPLSPREQTLSCMPQTSSTTPFLPLPEAATNAPPASKSFIYKDCSISTQTIPLNEDSNVLSAAGCTPSPMPSSSAVIPTTIVSFDVQTSGETVIDLPYQVDNCGNLCLVSESVADNERKETSEHASPAVTECPTDLALKVVESALTDELKKKYMDAYKQGKVIDDSLYHTWKMYYEKRSPPSISSSSASASSSELFSIPFQQKRPPMSKRKHIGQYFVISSDEAYREMKKAKEEKKQKAEEIKQRKLMRETIKKEKENIKKEKAMKKAVKK